nr:flippase [Oscillospiraceae bacterium]
MNLKKILRNRTVANAGWIIGGRLMNKVLAFLVSIFTARYLGPDHFGLINYTAAFTTFFASLCNLGINSVIIKNFVDHPEEEGQTIGTTLVLRAVSSLLSAVMIVGIVSILDSGESMTILVAFLGSIGLLFQIFDTFKYWFQSRLQSKYAAIATVLSYAVMSGYKIILLLTGRSVAWFAMATSVDYVVVAVFLLAAYRKNGGPALSFSGKKARELLKASGNFILSGLMVSVYASTDRLMLKQMLDDSSVAYYSLAVSLSTTWAFVLQAVIDSMYPAVLQSFGQDKAVFSRKNRQMYAIVIYMAAAVSLVISLYAQPIVQMLYGQAYFPAVRPLRIVVWYTAFSYLGVARNAWIVSMNCQRYLKYLYCGAAIINVALNWLLIPQWGPSGAAAASLVTQISTVALLPLVIPPLRPNARLMLEALLLRDVLPGKRTEK